MNILIVSENFLSGGLETQIITTVESLNSKVNFFFAFGKYNSNWNLNNVYNDFNFSFSSTISEFCDDVDRLVDIIKKNHIDIVHAHPFYSLFPAVFAAKLCGIPIVYTYHGISSYNFTFNTLDTILFNMLIDYEVDKIFCVNNEGKQIIDNILFNKDKTVFLPNSININKFKKQNINNNKSWALISRLDIDKINEIKKIISIMEEIDINELHILGDGSEKSNLEQFIINKNLSNKVFLDGHKNNIPEAISNNYNGIIGIGRVIMEGISMQLPVLLIGYNKIAGIIDDNLYKKIEDKNFINTFIPDIDLQTLKKQIQDIYNNCYNCNYYKSFENKFSSENLSNIYYKELLNINYQSLINISSLFDEIKKLNYSESFYRSDLVYQIIRAYLSTYIRLPHQKNLFIIQDYITGQANIYNNINTLINTIPINQDSKFKELEEKISDISQNTMTLNNLKRKIKYKFKH